MNRQVVEAVMATSGHIFVDCTTGMGGHIEVVLRACPSIQVLAVDQDKDSLDKARQRLQMFSERITYVHGEYSALFSIHPLKPASISALLIDPGLSMVQLSEGARGFSYRLAGPLDMRKDRRQSLTADQILNGYTFEKLLQVFCEYGEVHSAERIVQAIVHRRLREPFVTTTQLTDLIEAVTHWHPKAGLLHPAARVFQALRIEVNDELMRLEGFLKELPSYMEPGGRILVLSYHSVEDRLVKRVFREMAQQNGLELVKPFPAKPSAMEVAENSPSRSAKLRELRVS